MFQIPFLSKWSITLAFSIYNSVQVNRASISIYSNSDAPYQNSNYLNRYSWGRSSVQVEFESLLWSHDASGQLHRPAMLPERDFLAWKFKKIKFGPNRIKFLRWSLGMIRWDLLNLVPREDNIRFFHFDFSSSAFIFSSSAS